MRIAFYTLGCKVNQYETQALEQLAVARGHTLVPFEDEADAYVVNTCTVTAMSDKKSRQAVRRARRQCPGAVVAVCGCYPQTQPEAAAGLGADLVCGTGNRSGFLDLLEETWATRAPAEDLDSPWERRTFEQLPAGGLAGRTRAMLKVEDGCSNFCAYCVIPYARGPVRSLPLEQAAAQAGALAEEGYREIVITGIEISSWGRDLEGGLILADLTEAVCAAAPGCRIRLSSLEPRTVTEDFCRRMAALPNLCDHFHLSLQSGCDATLARMNRKYDTARYYESVTLLRKFYPNPAITADLIVGFPGETEEEFQESLAFLEKCALTAVHVFPYSRRPGTRAESMPDQIRNAVREDRSRRAAAAAARLHENFMRTQIGRQAEVLFEEERDGLWVGHTRNYLTVGTEGSSLHNCLAQVRILRLQGDLLLGEITDA